MNQNILAVLRTFSKLKKKKKKTKRKKLYTKKTTSKAATTEFLKIPNRKKISNEDFSLFEEET